MKKSTTVKYRLYRLIWAGIDVVFPPTCGGCGKLGSRWCQECQQNLTLLPEPVCEICGLPQSKPGICNLCQSSRPAFEKMRSWVVFKQPVQNALHRLKYRRDISLGDSLAAQMLDYLNKQNWNFQFVIPIPLSQQRKAERGYNQVGFIARPIAYAGGWQYMPAALKRIKHTNSQVGLSRSERKENVQNAFQADAKLVQGKSILLMDDVITTGATVAEAATALIAAGAQKVYVFSVARALAHDDLKRI